jgi:hypothetical protein
MEAQLEFDFVKNIEVNQETLDFMMEEVYSNVHEFFIEDPTVEALLRKFEERSNEGMKKYNTSIRDNDSFNNAEWVDEALQEAMDLCVYLMKVKENLNGIK